MKKFVLLMALTVFGTGAITVNAHAANVQQGQGGGQGGQNMTPEQRLERTLAMMTEQLTLTADQSAKIKPILVERMKEQNTLREKFQGGDRDAMMAEYRKLTEKYNPQIKAILTAEQYTKYEAMPNRGGGQRQGGGAQGGGNQR